MSMEYIAFWSMKVQRNEKTRDLIENIPNIRLILESDARWTGVFRYNEMARRVFVHKSLPGEDPGEDLKEPTPLEDYHVSVCQSWMQQYGAMPLARNDFVSAAVQQVARANAYNPIQLSLNTLVWDGKPRLDSWLCDYCGAPDIPYTRAIGRMFMIGMVKRVMEPGCKMDYMLILEGPQGIGKSTVCEILGTPKFTGVGHFKDLDSPDTSIFLKNKWVVEIGEMHAMRKAEVNELKLWLVKTVEDYRPKYGKENLVEPRQCVFIGTSNGGEYLRDPTGGRRFWPVWCKFVKRDELKADRDQIMAEALTAWKAGEDPYPTEAFEKEHFVTQQEARQLADPWEEFLMPFLLKHSQVNLEQICSLLKMEKNRLDQLSQARIKDILTSNGWEQKRTKTARYWTKVGAPRKSLEEAMRPAMEAQLRELKEAQGET